MINIAGFMLHGNMIKNADNKHCCVGVEVAKISAQFMPSGIL